MPIAVPPPPARLRQPIMVQEFAVARVSDPCNRYSAVVAICRRQAKGIQHMSRHREAQKSCREHYCQNHNRDHLFHQVISVKRSNSTFDFYCYLRNEHPALAKNSQAATCSPLSQFGLCSKVPTCGVGCLRKYPCRMSQLCRLCCGRNFMLAASVVVVAAITFVSALTHPIVQFGERTPHCICFSSRTITMPSCLSVRPIVDSLT
jgi:hypothetical protein